MLIVLPTRELAVQVEESVRTYARSLPLRSTVVHGGVPMDPQVKALWGGVEILVATPGRLLDHLGQGTVKLGQVEVLVLDEADRMLDMGFIPDVRRIVALLTSRRQTLFFSATFSDEIRRLAREFLHDPETVEVARRNSVADNLTQALYPVDGTLKADLLVHLIRQEQMTQVLVFTRTKTAASRLAAHLDRRGVPATAIHSDRSQPERTRALEGFKRGDIAVLVATDVASRGLDIDELPHVVNFELPFDPQDYIHRIGRTGRAGASGVAISLVSPEEVDQLRGVQRLLRRAIPVRVAEDFLPGRGQRDADTDGAPAQGPGGRGSGSRRAPGYARSRTAATAAR